MIAVRVASRSSNLGDAKLLNKVILLLDQLDQLLYAALGQVEFLAVMSHCARDAQQSRDDM